MKKPTKKEVPVETFARVTWCWEDIKSRRPRWSRAKCEEFLAQNERRIQERMCEMGWEVIDCLL